jgi:Zn-dependent protease with chaperone function
MSFWALAGLAALASLAAIGFVGSVLSRLAIGRVERDPDAHSRASKLLALRLLPPLTGLALAASLVLPAFLVFEPRNAQETPGLAITLLATVGGLAIAAGLRRSLADFRATRGVRRAWERQGRIASLPGAPAPAYVIRHEFPVVSVVGILRPRLFVAEQVLERLSASELAAVLAHEAGHLSSLDNLKRLALRLSPVISWPGLARRLDSAWDEAVEEAADSTALNGLELASALVKTARLVPSGSRLDLPVAAFHRGDSVARRVRLLTDAVRPGPSRSRLWRAWAFALAAIMLIAAATSQLNAVHQLLEPLVHVL